MTLCTESRQGEVASRTGYPLGVAETLIALYSATNL